MGLIKERIIWKGLFIGLVFALAEISTSLVGIAEENQKTPENLLKNPGFEEGTAGWGYAVLDETVSHSGKASAILKSGQPAGTRLYQSLPVGGGYGKFKSGVTYVLSFWAKADPPSGWEKMVQAQLLLEKDIDKVVLVVKPKIDEEIRDKDNWVQFYAEFQIPEEVASSPKSYYYFTIWTPKIDTHTIWLDDFKFMEVKAKTP